MRILLYMYIIYERCKQAIEREKLNWIGKIENAFEYNE